MKLYLNKIFPDWKTGFDAFVTARGFKWSASITKIQHNDVGEAIVNIVLTDQKGHSMSERDYDWNNRCKIIYARIKGQV